MKTILISAAISSLITLLGLVINYKIAVEPANAHREMERQVLTELVVNGDRAEAAVILTGRQNARFQVIAQEIGTRR